MARVPQFLSAPPHVSMYTIAISANSLLDGSHGVALLAVAAGGGCREGADASGLDSAPQRVVRRMAWDALCLNLRF